MTGTSYFLLWDAHDVKGLHGFGEQVFVLLPRNGHASVRQETVLAVIFQTQLSWERRGEDMCISFLSFYFCKARPTRQEELSVMTDLRKREAPL